METEEFENVHLDILSNSTHKKLLSKEFARIQNLFY